MSLTDRTTTSFLTSSGAHSAGWISSLLLHATLVFGAFVFTQQITLAHQVTPFRWNVAMVAPASPTTINPSSQSVAPAAKPPASPPSPRRSAMTEQPTPIAPPSPAPPPTPKQDTLVTRPHRVPAIMTPPAPTDTAAQEQSVVRPFEPAPQPASAASAPVSASGHPEPRHESLPEIHEPPTPLRTPPSQVSHQALVSEPTTAATPIQPIAGQPTPGETVQREPAPAPQVAAMAPVPPSASSRLD